MPSHARAHRPLPAACCPQIVFTSLRFTLAAAAFAPFLARGLACPDVRRSGVEIGLWTAAGYLAQSWALALTPASRASLLSTFTVIAVPCLAGLSGQRVKPLVWACGIAALVGTTLLEQGGGEPPNAGAPRGGVRTHVAVCAHVRAAHACVRSCAECDSASPRPLLRVLPPCLPRQRRRPAEHPVCALLRNAALPHREAEPCTARGLGPAIHGSDSEHGRGRERDGGGGGALAGRRRGGWQPGGRAGRCGACSAAVDAAGWPRGPPSVRAAVHVIC